MTELKYKLIIGFLVSMILIGVASYYTFLITEGISEEVIRQSQVYESSEDLFRNSFLILDSAEAYVSRDNRMEEMQIESGFLDSMGEIDSSIASLRDAGADEYLLSLVEDYIVATNTSFLELTRIHAQMKGEHDAEVVASLELEKRKHIITIDDSRSKLDDVLDAIINNSQTGLNKAVLRANDISFTSRMILLLSIAIGFIWYIFIAHSITKPLSLLSQNIERVGKGDLHVKVKSVSNDEIGRVATTFNRMVDDLRESQKKLRERTKELERTNMELKSRMGEIERFNRMAVGRELAMIKMKKRMRALEKKLSER